MPTSNKATKKQSPHAPVDQVRFDEETKLPPNAVSTNETDGVFAKLWSSTKEKALFGKVVSHEDVAWCYHNLLGRAPESGAVVEAHIRTSNFRDLVAAFVNSQEYRSRFSRENLGGRDSGASLLQPLDRLVIDVDASNADLGKCATKIKKVWEHLGQEKAHFSVVTDESFLPQNLSGSIDSFWASGEREVERAIRTLKQYGMADFERKVCVEYGCGVGRVTVNLAKSFKTVHAYDISRNHLNFARTRANEVGSHNIEFHECSHDFRVAIEPCDFFHSIIVLQHNPPPVIMELIRIALRALKPGGFAIFQVPTYIVDYQFDLNKWLAADHGMDMQMHCVPQDAVLDAIVAHGCRLLNLREDGWTASSELMISNTFICRKQ